MTFFRRAGREDAAIIREITHRAYEKWVPVIGRLPKPMTADYSQAVEAHIVDLLVDDDNRILGLIEIILGADHLLIENVAVDPTAQGRGYGKALVAHAEDMARHAGHGCVRLYTNKLFVANVALYARLGYTIDREEAFRGGLIVHMSKKA